MDGNTLRQCFQDLVPASMIEDLASRLHVVERNRKKDVCALVWALALTAGGEDSGRLADIYTKYLDEAKHEVVRGSFYSWFTERFSVLVAAVLQSALGRVRKLKPHLPGGLGGVRDWILVDSETITLPDSLLEQFPSTSSRAGLKIHKFFSVGRNNIIDYRITSARVHDGPVLRVDATWRGMGLVVDRAYASTQLIRDCQEHGVVLVTRLKDGWKPRLLGVADPSCGAVAPVQEGIVLESLLSEPVDTFEGHTVDLDVRCGRGTKSVDARLVGVVPKQKYHWYLTTSTRKGHSAELVSDLYRSRWEVEIEMKRDKTGAGIDQIRATSYNSVMALVLGGLLHTLLANHIVYTHQLSRPANRAPLHGLAVALTMRATAGPLLSALVGNKSTQWMTIARSFRHRGEDPNWRRRPSALDRLKGAEAPPGRQRRVKMADSPPEAAPYMRRAS